MSNFHSNLRIKIMINRAKATACTRRTRPSPLSSSAWIPWLIYWNLYVYLRNQISSDTLLLHSPAERRAESTLDFDIAPVHYRALRLSKWELLLFIRDAPTRQILHVTEAECLFNLLKEWKTLTVGGGLSCHSFLRRLLFFPSVFFPVRVDSAGFIGAARCVSRAAFLARTLVFGLGGRGARDALRATEDETRQRAAPWSSRAKKKIVLLYTRYQKKIKKMYKNNLRFCFN